jgi:penicillin-binding protein 1A
VNTLEPAVVMEVAEQEVTVLRGNGSLITIPWSGLSWARKQVSADFLGRMPETAGEILKVGDVIRVAPNGGSWRLSQVPKAEAGMVALNPQNGEILAMNGGFDFQNSNFNRITNALRQPGSSFKPFIYSASLERGYTLASVINDAPIVIENPVDNTLWRPQNDTGKFYGPTRLREALVHSRNLVSIRLLGLIGTKYGVSYAQKFGFTASQLPPTLSLALGTANVTPLDMATGYAVFANGGFRITPFIIDTIRNSAGQIIYQAKPLTACPTCSLESLPVLVDPKTAAAAKKAEAEAKDDDDDTSKTEVPVAGLSPSIVRKDTTHAPRVISPQNSFLITSTLHDVIQYGTATQARSLQRKDLAGKTGTTSNQVDAWFVGYNTDLVALSWVGFDQPQSLHEYGAQAALPIWINFMQEALRNKPEHMLEQPTGIKTILVNSYSGQRTSGHDPDGINEIFMEPYLPGEEHEHHHTAFGDNSNHDHEDDGSSGVGDQAPPDGDGGGVY